MKRIIHATHFAATKHAEQRRKNSAATPYINHPVEVADHLTRIGGITDEDIVIAALLHDTIEDTETTEDEIIQLFGARVARIVMDCTDDKSLPKADRKRLQVEKAASKSVEAKQVKIADKTCNLASIIADPPQGWSTERQMEYFTWAEKVISGLRGVNQQLDDYVDQVLEKGKKTIAARTEPSA